MKQTTDGISLGGVTYQSTMIDFDEYKTESDSMVVLGKTYSATKVYGEGGEGPGPSKVIYGVKIDLKNSNPESSVTYTDDSENFEGSYMDFAKDSFVWGSWKDKFPFNQIKPCYMVNGVVTKYLDPNDYSKDIEGNSIDITSSGNGDVMIEIPKIYYYLHNDSNYQYIQISNEKVNDNYCCLAHTHKGEEKDKVYLGAYLSYTYSNKMRSVTNQTPEGGISLDVCRSRARNNGNGYENFYWDLLILLQSLFTIQFKNLDSQKVMGYGFCNTQTYEKVGSFDKKGMNYGTSGTLNSRVKWLGFEDLWGNMSSWIDGARISNTKNLITIDSTNPNLDYNNQGDGYLDRGYTISNSNDGYIKKIMGTNSGGFVPTDNSASSSTYFCDRGRVEIWDVNHTGGTNLSTDKGGIYCTDFNNQATLPFANCCGRLAFCG